MGVPPPAVDFASDAFFRPSSDREAVLVFALLGGGAGGSFVIGNLNGVVGNSVPWWRAQWAKLNSLSGGPAPAAFKGFADMTSTTPPTCGGTWTTDPGNRSGPPATVPAFMAVIASNGIGGQNDRGHLLRFLFHKGVEPTNNRAKRILRPAVIARKAASLTQSLLACFSA